MKTLLILLILLMTTTFLITNNNNNIVSAVDNNINNEEQQLLITSKISTQLKLNNKVNHPLINVPVVITWTSQGGWWRLWFNADNPAGGTCTVTTEPPPLTGVNIVPYNDWENYYTIQYNYYGNIHYLCHSPDYYKGNEWAHYLSNTFCLYGFEYIGPSGNGNGKLYKFGNHGTTTFLNWMTVQHLSGDSDWCLSVVSHYNAYSAVCGPNFSACSFEIRPLSEYVVDGG
jgi:hypothetical protein